MDHTHYTPISRDSGGMITRLGGKRALAKRGLPGIPGATEHAVVVEVIETDVIGWGDATAIGMVVMYVDNVACSEPILSLLS